MRSCFFDAQADTSGGSEIPPADTLGDAAEPPDEEQSLLDREFEYVAAGATRKEPLKAILKRASKSFGADEALRTAAEQRKEADKIKEDADAYAAFQEMMEKATDEPGAFKQVLDALGWDDKFPGLGGELWKVFSEGVQSSTQKTSARPEHGATEVDPTVEEAKAFIRALKKTGLETPEQMAQAVALSLGSAGAWGAEKRDKMLLEALDKHEKLGKMVFQNSGLRDKLFKTASQDIQRRERQGQRAAEAIEEVLELMASAAPDASAKPARSDDSTRAIFHGIGPAPVGAPPSQLHPGERPKPDPKRLGEPGYLGKFVDATLENAYAEGED